jgi:3-oxoacyl-[acyl-carrier protein] reductase
MPGELAYAMSKGAIEVLTKCLAVSLRPKGITVNAVDPGGTDTGWIAAVPGLADSITATTLHSRLGMAEDAARLILFLASAQSDWITGQVIHSRGGA